MHKPLMLRKNTAVLLSDCFATGTLEATTMNFGNEFGRSKTKLNLNLAFNTDQFVKEIMTRRYITSAVLVTPCGLSAFPPALQTTLLLLFQPSLAH